MKKGIQLKHVMALALGVSSFSSAVSEIYALSASPTPATAPKPSPTKEAPVANTNSEKSKGSPVDPKVSEIKPAEAKADVKPCNTLPLNFDISKGFSSIAEKAVLGVVNVSTTQIVEGGRLGAKEGVPQFPPGSPFEDFFKEFFDQMERPRKVQSLGSGFIIQSDESSAIIVTNFHVIADAKKITVFLNDNTELEATVLAVDERTDIALLKVKTDSLSPEMRKLPTLEWGNCNMSKVGDWVLAIGNPFGLGSTVTSGIISNRARDIMMGRGGGGRNRMSDYVDDFIQHDAAINMGNSGGPLLNLEGKVIAINTAIYSPSGGSVGIGFAIPASVAQDTVRQLLEFGRTKRGWVGVRFQPVTPDIAESLGLSKASGGIVGSVTPDGPAAKAGIEPGDIILEFDGKPINDKSKLPRLVGETPVGKSVTVKIWRKGKEINLNMVLGEFETPPDRRPHSDAEKSKAHQDMVEVLGIQLEALTPELKEHYKLNSDAKGIVVRKVDINSTAREIGLRPGDIIEKVNHKKIAKPEEFAKAVEEAKTAKHKNILLLVTRDGDPRFAPLKLENEDLMDGSDSKSKESKDKATKDKDKESKDKDTKDKDSKNKEKSKG